MLNQPRTWIAVILLALLASITFFLHTKVFLVVFIAYPAFLFPYFYLRKQGLALAKNIYLGCAVAVALYFLLTHFSLEVLGLIILQIMLWLSFYFYEYEWGALLARESEQKNLIEKDLDAMSRKHDSRMASLHHLEKQVMGLLDLFEVAKDFSEYLSYKSIAEILYKRVKPLFPFQRLKLLIIQDTLNHPEHYVRFIIDENGPVMNEDPVDETEIQWMHKLLGSKSISQTGKTWIFPLLFDDLFHSFLMVESAHPDDLAKFEVLSSFLNLQIAKIKLYEAVKELAIRDGLTQVFVRRHFLERFEEELRRAVKYSIPLAVLMLDIDHFKRYNDEHGHLAGDATLQQVAQMICQSLRKVDIVGRYGGEEFSVVIPETRKEGALEISERIRSNIARNVFTIYNTDTRVTASIGVALFVPDDTHKQDNIDYNQLAFELIQNADKALYRAKEEGRNQVILFSHS